MMPNSILLGQYRPSNSYLHLLDARAKMLAVLAIMILSLVSESILFSLFIIAALLIGLVMSHVSGKALFRSFMPMMLLVGLTAIFHLIFSGGDSQVVFTVFGWEIQTEALRMAAFYSLRVILFVAAAFLMTLTSSPSELSEALVQFLQPLRKLRMPVNDIGLILFIAIRFLPILYDEFVIIRNAQIMRGVDFSGSLILRIRKTSYLLIPVFVAAIGRADDLALAIEARGYDSYARRTLYSRSRFGLREGIFMVGAIGLVLFVFMVTQNHD